MLPLLLMVAVLVEPPQGGGGGRASGPIMERSPEPVELKVVLSAPVYQPDGAVSSETATLPNGPSSVMYVYGRKSLCETATRSMTEPPDAGFGWRVTSQTISQTPTELVVGVDWRRLWDRGQRVPNGPSGTVHLTLHPGDRIPLDHIPNPSMNDACRAVGLGLEIKLARTTAVLPMVPDRLLPVGATVGGTSALDADLWLVDTRPTGGQKIAHQTVRVPKAGGTFSFDTVNLTTPQGPVGVEFSGALARYQVSTTGEQLLLSVTRVITGASAPPGGYRGSSMTPLSLPSPLDVLSFEFQGALQAIAVARGGGGGGGVGGVVARSGGGGGGRGGGGTGGTAQTGTSTVPTEQLPNMMRQRSGGAAASAVPPSGAAAAQMRTPSPSGVTLLDGHVFELRVRLTPVAGS